MSDLISRQQAILAIERNAYRHTYLDQIVDIIKWLPSVPNTSNALSALDCVARQAAIDAVNGMPDCPNGYSDTYDKAHIIAVLEDVPSVRPQRWIPVTEELPDELGDIVVISTKGGRVREAMYVPSGDEQAFVTKDCWYCHGEVVAWMPLPEPYRGAQDETRGVSETP